GFRTGAESFDDHAAFRGALSVAHHRPSSRIVLHRYGKLANDFDILVRDGIRGAQASDQRSGDDVAGHSALQCPGWNPAIPWQPPRREKRAKIAAGSNIS